ncbi:hypothetical protein [Leptospira sanjuanensis]|nr:hypothetical protein [Leptospira sanjuanensis]MCG6169464.1 hypothetical protein [Leptospira sanjuanensis]
MRTGNDERCVSLVENPIDSAEVAVYSWKLVGSPAAFPEFTGFVPALPV